MYKNNKISKTLTAQSLRTFACCMLLLCSAGQLTRAQTDDKVPLPIKLPRPVFAGTASNLTPAQLARIEKPSNKPRPVPLVPKGTINLALHKKVTSSSRPISGPLDKITDGDKEATEEGVVELKTKLQWVQIDLGAASPLFYVAVWHSPF